ncbi:MAG: hypothetical protein JJU00_06095 [Opitutales bacterium]|nr:hypothetical protein [Opitutales bacterium]
MQIRWTALLWVGVCFVANYAVAAPELRMQDLERTVENLERALREARRPHAEAMPRRDMPPPRRMKVLPREDARLHGDAPINPGRDRPGLLRRAPATSSPRERADRPVVMDWSGRTAPEPGSWRQTSRRASDIDAAGQARLVANAPVVRVDLGRPSLREALESVSLEDVNRYVFRRNRADSDGLPSVRAGGE